MAVKKTCIPLAKNVHHSDLHGLISILHLCMLSLSSQGNLHVPVSLDGIFTSQLGMSFLYQYAFKQSLSITNKFCMPLAHMHINNIMKLHSRKAQEGDK